MLSGKSFPNLFLYNHTNNGQDPSVDTCSGHVCHGGCRVGVRYYMSYVFFCRSQYDDMALGLVSGYFLSFAFLWMIMYTYCYPIVISGSCISYALMSTRNEK